MAKSASTTEKTNAWNELARYIRIKRCLETTGLPFVGICVTCGKKFHRDYLDCGHAIAGKRNAIFLNHHLLDIQCRMCNQNYNGRLKRYREVMVDRHGEAWVDRWWAKLKNMTIKDGSIHWKERASRARRKKKELMLLHGVLWEDGRE